MSAAAIQSEQPATTGPSFPLAVVRTPFYWTSLGEPLFGWLHTNGQQRHFDHAVVIAPPIGYEQLHSQRSLRHLADALARCGIPTLRFDWHGTGDSAGRDEDPQRLDVWRSNLHDAVHWLKTRCAIRRISVIGLRLGATIAATTLATREIEHLVLWAPVVSGRTYVREMTAIDRTSEIPPTRVPGAPDDLEPAGLLLSEATAKDITRINLLQSPPLRCRTLIVARDDLPVDGRLQEHYSAAGVPVEQILGSGYAAMMADPHKGDVPSQTIEAITQWLASSIGSSSGRPVAPPFEVCAAREATVRFQPEGATTAAAVEVRERALSISAAPELFGILAEPTTAVDPERPVIIVLNAGAAYRVGPGRMHVHLARRLAAEGFRCLRIDANGLGDSVAAEGASQNQSYASTIFRDVDLTLRFLQENKFGRTFVLAGLCSGAYFAFQSAVSLSDPALIESILINPLTYFWKDGMVISESSDRQLLVQNYYFESALDPRKWIKLFSGNTKIGVHGAVRLLVQRLGRKERRDPRGPNGGASPRPLHAHPLEDDLTADLDQAVARRRHLLMIFGKGDPGYGILLGKAGKRAKQLQQSGQLEIEFVTDTDHNFSRRAVRLELMNRLADHLKSRYAST